MPPPVRCDASGRTHPNQCVPDPRTVPWPSANLDIRPARRRNGWPAAGRVPVARPCETPDIVPRPSAWLNESASQVQTQVTGAPEWSSTQSSALSSVRPSKSAAVALVRAACGLTLRPDPVCIGTTRRSTLHSECMSHATLEPRHRNRPDDPVVRRFQMSRVGSSAERTAASILGGHPSKRTADKCARCIGLPRL